MIDPLQAPSEVLNALARLKASCLVIPVNKLNIQADTPNTLWSREEERAWKDKYSRKKPSGAQYRKKRLQKAQDALS